MNECETCGEERETTKVVVVIGADGPLTYRMCETCVSDLESLLEGS